MTVARVYTRGPVTIDTVTLGGITNQNIGNSSTFSNLNTHGEVRNRFVGLTGAVPSASFSTLSVAAALTITGALPYDMSTDADEGIAAVAMYGVLKTQGGGRTLASVNKSYTMANGIMVPTTLQVDHQGDAELSYALFPISSDGIIEPIISAEAATVPAAAETVERFTLGSVSIGGVTLTQVRSLSIDFGITVNQIGADSDIFPSFAYDDSRMPSLTLSGIDLDWFKAAAAIDLQGLAGTIVNTIIYLRKRSGTISGGFVADATAEHIKIQSAGITTIESAMDASGDSDGTCGIRLSPFFDGTNETLLIAPASAIT